MIHTGGQGVLKPFNMLKQPVRVSPGWMNLRRETSLGNVTELNIFPRTDDNLFACLCPELYCSSVLHKLKQQHNSSHTLKSFHMYNGQFH